MLQAMPQVAFRVASESWKIGPGAVGQVLAPVAARGRIAERVDPRPDRDRGSCSRRSRHRPPVELGRGAGLAATGDDRHREVVLGRLGREALLVAPSRWWTTRAVAVQQPIVAWAQVNVGEVSNDGTNIQFVANTSAASS